MSTESFKELKICIAGPSYVGKTSFLNRLINNTFYSEYFPTNELEKFKFVYQLPNSATAQFYYIEIHDTFPIDHPNLYTGDNRMEEQLESIVKNKDKAEKRIYDGYIFIYNCTE